MSYYDKNFIETFNEYYPFERYIVKEPKQINYLFDDIVLIELFVPSTEIKPCVDEEGVFHGFTSINNEDIYVKLKCGDSEFRMAYYDFNDHIREEIRFLITKDFTEWESLYIDYDDESVDEELKKALLIQKQLITNKYGKCNIKPNFIIEDTIKLLNG
jgi:hypothetical protein